MPLVQCTFGAIDATVGNDTYSFQKDRAGRFVAQVSNYHHVNCLLGNQFYKLVDERPLPIPPSALETPVVEDPAAETGAEQTGGDSQSGDPVIDPPAAPVTAPVPAPDVPAAPPAPPAAPPAPAPEPAPEPHQPDIAPVALDRLVAISGIGEATAVRLGERGITTFAQISALTEAQITELDAALNLKGGIVRNEWVNQANILIAKAAKQTNAQG